MATYPFPDIIPSSTSWRLVSNTAAYSSPLTGATQTLDRSGERWACSLSFENLTGDEKATMKAFLARLNGQQHRFTMPDHSLVQRGLLSGTPLVNGANQLGNVLNIDGAATSVTGWARAGDMISVNDELKMVVVDADSNGSSQVSLEVIPRITVSPADNTPIVTASPTGTFMLVNNESGWGNKPGNFGDFSFDAVQDIL